jgi:hypothetical protein
VVIGIMNDEWWSILFEHVIHQPFIIHHPHISPPKKEG